MIDIRKSHEIAQDNWSPFKSKTVGMDTFIVLPNPVFNIVRNAHVIETVTAFNNVNEILMITGHSLKIQLGVQNTLRQAQGDTSCQTFNYSCQSEPVED